MAALIQSIFVALKTVSHRNHMRPISTTSGTAPISSSRSMYTVFLSQNPFQKTLRRSSAIKVENGSSSSSSSLQNEIKNCLPIIIEDLCVYQARFHSQTTFDQIYLFLSLSSRETHCEVDNIILHPVRVIFQR